MTWFRCQYPCRQLASTTKKGKKKKENGDQTLSASQQNAWGENALEDFPANQPLTTSRPAPAWPPPP